MSDMGSYNGHKPNFALLINGGLTTKQLADYELNGRIADGASALHMDVGRFMETHPDMTVHGRPKLEFAEADKLGQVIQDARTSNSLKPTVTKPPSLG